MYIGRAQVHSGGKVQITPDHSPCKIHMFLYKIAIGPPPPEKSWKPLENIGPGPHPLAKFPKMRVGM